MVAAIGADIQGTNEPVLDVDMAALVALLPRVGWDLQFDPFRRARFALFLEPGHSRHRGGVEDRKSTRLNSSHGYISYAVFCLKKKQKLDYYLWLSPAH